MSVIILLRQIERVVQREGDGASRYTTLVHHPSLTGSHPISPLLWIQCPSFICISGYSSKWDNCHLALTGFVFFVLYLQSILLVLFPVFSSSTSSPRMASVDRSKWLCCRRYYYIKQVPNNKRLKQRSSAGNHAVRITQGTPAHLTPWASVFPIQNQELKYW
jgi:hypothetical protein